MDINHESNIVFEHLHCSDKRIIVEQGGTRSGKTYNILIWLIINAINTGNTVTSIVRKTRPALKASAYRDFIEILETMKLYNPRRHNKSDMSYKLGSNLFEFFSLDESAKVKGRKRDNLFINEANEINFEDWRQLMFRSSGRVILDYNPSDEHHFIYDKIITRNDCELFITTYRDNTFLPKILIEEIERLKDPETGDENYWKIYGLGERGKNEELVYNNIIYLNEFPYKSKDFEVDIMGLDFGFNNPTVLTKISMKDKQFYLEERLFQSGMTNLDLIKFLKENLTPEEKAWSIPIYADAAEPARIEALRREGFNVIAADKAVKTGIDFCKAFKLNSLTSNINLNKEFKRYKWKKDRDGKILDEVVKLFDHGMDTIRYGIYTHYKNIYDIDPKKILQELEDSLYDDEEYTSFSDVY